MFLATISYYYVVPAISLSSKTPLGGETLHSTHSSLHASEVQTVVILLELVQLSELPVSILGKLRPISLYISQIINKLTQINCTLTGTTCQICSLLRTSSVMMSYRITIPLRTCLLCIGDVAILGYQIKLH